MKFDMRILFGLVLVLFLGIVDGYPTYDEYLHDFGKKYDSGEEIMMRRQIYEDRMKLFETITEYTPGVNHMTDWTEQEINKLKNPNLHVPPQNIQTKQQQSSSLRVSTTFYPSSLDWRERQAVTSVKNQLTCGSCWAFAAVAYIESKLIIESKYPTTVDLSEQYLLSCTPGSDCSGGYLIDTLKVAAQGLPYESSFPYNPYGSVNSQICQTKNKVTEAGQSYRRIDDITDQTLIRLLQRGPVPVMISSEKWHFYGGGVFSCPTNSVPDHAVIVVGYTSTYWIVKNQWGKDWGESGYMRITRSRTTTGANCLIGYMAVYLDPVVIAEESSEKILSKAFTLISFVLIILII